MSVCAVLFTLRRRSELGVGKEADIEIPKVHLRLVETPGVKNCLKRPVSESWTRKSSSALSLQVWRRKSSGQQYLKIECRSINLTSTCSQRLWHSTATDEHSTDRSHFALSARWLSILAYVWWQFATTRTWHA